MKRGPMASDLTTAYMVGPITSGKRIYSNAFISSMYSALCVILQVPKSGSGDWLRVLAKASKNSGILWLQYYLPFYRSFLSPYAQSHRLRG